MQRKGQMSTTNDPPKDTKSLDGFPSNGPGSGPAALAGPPFPQTRETARQWFRDNGVNITEWCRQKGVGLQRVKDLLRGKDKGHRGESHLAAVALSLKVRHVLIPDATAPDRKDER